VERKKQIMKYYTGIGSRVTPKVVLDAMEIIGNHIAIHDYALRSGGANGADAAFESGCDQIQGPKEIYLPWAKKFHSRNVHQVLGRDLKTPSDFVICWTADGGFSGGTGQALRIADDHGIPIFNMNVREDVRSFREFMRELNRT
jgi:hypothetical protein